MRGVKVFTPARILPNMPATTAAARATSGTSSGDEQGDDLVRTIGTAAVLAAMWLLMSGLFKPLILGFGAASVVLVMFVVRRMDSIDGDRIQLCLKPVASVGYFLWLLKEIAKANWAVTKIILKPSMAIRQHLFIVPLTQHSDLGQTIFANSITLTPGTITVETEPGHFLVHAVAYSEGDHDALADMDRRVTATETPVEPQVTA